MFLSSAFIRLPPPGKLDLRGEFHNFRGFRKAFESEDFGQEEVTGEEYEDKRVPEFIIDQYFQDIDND